MDRAKIDTSEVYAYREGRYGKPVPVRVFDPLTRYVKVGGRFEKLTGSVRSGYGNKLRGGFLLARVRGGYADTQAVEALQALTLDNVLAGDTGPAVHVELAPSTRWVWDETWGHYQVRHEQEQRLTAERTAAKTAAENGNQMIGDDLRGVLQERLGWVFDYSHARLSTDAYNVTLTMTPQLARELTETLRRA